MIDLPRDVCLILSRLHNNGYSADVVGGPVRDFFLGETPSDYDITTSATPDRIKEIFSDMRTVDTGILHGTVTVVLGGENYEITTYRIDGEYKDSRHPDSVTFTSDLNEDLARRDFTVNAMAYSPLSGISDPFDGRGDIDRRIIRTVGDPVRRFEEDALRMLRALRFSSKLDFDIEEATRVTIFELWHRLSGVSRERVWVELYKLFSGKRAYSVLKEYASLLAELLSLSEIKLPSRELFEDVGWYLRLLSVFALSSIDPALNFERAMRKLRTDNRTRECGASVLGMIGENISGDYALLKVASRIGAENTLLLLRLRAVLGEDTSVRLERFNALIESGTPYRISDLNIDGKRLMELGAKGRTVGELLSSLLDSVMSGKVENTESALIREAELILSNLSRKV